MSTEALKKAWQKGDSNTMYGHPKQQGRCADCNAGGHQLVAGICPACAKKAEKLALQLVTQGDGFEDPDAPRPDLERIADDVQAQIRGMIDIDVDDLQVIIGEVLYTIARRIRAGEAVRIPNLGRMERIDCAFDHDLRQIEFIADTRLLQ